MKCLTATRKGEKYHLVDSRFRTQKGLISFKTSFCYANREIAPEVFLFIVYNNSNFRFIGLDLVYKILFAFVQI